MNAQRLSRIAAGIAIVTALGVVGIITRNVLWPDDPDASLQRAGGKVLGDMTGYVGRVDRESRTVDVSASSLGIRPVPIVLTNDTVIVVNGKQGAIGDLWKDLPVRVYYEVRDNTRYATSIQVTSGDALAASPAGKDPGAAAPMPPAAQATASAPTAPVAATTPPAAPAPSRTATAPLFTTPASTSTAPASTSSTAATASAPRPAVSAPVASRPTPPATVAPSSAPLVPAAARVTEPSAPRVAEPSTAPSRAATPAPATESASVGSSGVRSGVARPAAEPDADGSAAIDWLLKGSGRR